MNGHHQETGDLNVPEESPFASRSDERLLRDFCVALDTIARHEGKPGLETFVLEIRQIHSELMKRGVNWTREIEAMAESSGRDVNRILEKYLAHPPTRD